MAKKDTIKFLKVRDVKSPSRAFEFDAGIDFYVPNFDKDFIKDLKDKNPLVFEGETTNKEHFIVANGSLVLTSTSSSSVKYDLSDYNNSIIKFDDEKGENYFLLAPHSRVMIPSGIKSRMASPGRALIASNKSGVATKHGLIFGAQVIDYTYKGEIHLSLINTSTKSVRIYEGMKILQLVETPVFFSEVEISTLSKDAENLFYDGLQDDRGAGGFGSTDKK